jgi:hypothetical protein
MNFVLAVALLIIGIYCILSAVYGKRYTKSANIER